jgi:serine/threonine protein kinase
MNGGWPSVPGEELNLPMIANRYRLVRSLGAGGLGEVYRAEDTKFSPPRIVAVKVLHPELLTDPAMLEQLRQEAGTMAHFSHPNILRVLDFEIAPQQAYIVTEYAAGGSLRDIMIPGQPLPLPEVQEYLRQIAHALDEAHAAGLIHRDIKPENILLDKSGRPLLADFSLALKVNSTLVDAESWGTAEYAAPEVWQGQAGKASDIYSLGVLLYELVTGRTPFHGDPSTLENKHLRATVPGVAVFRPVMPQAEALDKVFSRALAKSAEARPATATLLSKEFDAASVEVDPWTNRNAQVVFTSISISQSTPAASNNVVVKGPAAWIVLFGIFLFIGGTGVLSFVLFDRGMRNSRTGVTPVVIVPRATVAPVVISSSTTTTSTTVTTNFAFGQQKQLPFVAKMVMHGDWSPDGTKIALAVSNDTGTKVMLFDANGAYLKTLDTQSARRIAWSPDSRGLAVVGSSKNADLWDIEAGKIAVSLVGHEEAVWDVAWSPNGRQIVTAGQDKTVRMWQPDGKLVKRITGFNGIVRRIVWTKDGTKFAAGSEEGQVRIYEESGTLSNVYGDLSISDWSDLAWSPNGSELAVASAAGLKILHVAEASPTHFSTSVSTNRLVSVTWLNNGNLLIGSTSRGELEVHTTVAPLPIKLNAHDAKLIRAVRLSPDGKKLLTCSDDGTAKIIDLRL